MLAIKNPSELQQEKLDKLNTELKMVYLPQDAVDTLIWLTNCEMKTIDGIVSTIQTVKAFEQGEAIHCSHDAYKGFEKQYSSKSDG